ncbi:hypothetical protein CLIB1423_09S02784 [[Candida] railenensis]|uniref:Uncharacterized protein n=1 Tax=[Candida] railenensis TaxID=45579 RepID=A0A9P0QQL7_9ASCO|nr:hypothetical protein CLIB1423_09S02784 [[Candida] railenensis]
MTILLHIYMFTLKFKRESIICLQHGFTQASISQRPFAVSRNMSLRATGRTQPFNNPKNIKREFKTTRLIYNSSTESNPCFIPRNWCRLRIFQSNSLNSRRRTSHYESQRSTETSFSSAESSRKTLQNPSNNLRISLIEFLSRAHRNTD